MRKSNKNIKRKRRNVAKLRTTVTQKSAVSHKKKQSLQREVSVDDPQERKNWALSSIFLSYSVNNIRAGRRRLANLGKLRELLAWSVSDLNSIILVLLNKLLFN